MSTNTAASAARRREDLTAWFIFATLMAMAGVLTAAFLIEEEPYEDVVTDGVSERVYQGHGIAHPRFAVDPETPSMHHGGDGRERQESIVVFTCLFAVLCVVFGIMCIYLGSLRSVGPSPLKRPLILAGFIGCAVMATMFRSYWNSLGDTEPSYFLGLPAATAWMMYGVYPFPVLVVICYVCWFDRWFAPPQINGDFRQIMADARDREVESD